MIRFLILILAISQLSYAVEPEKAMNQWCTDMRLWMKKYNWKIEPCIKMDWKIGGYSELGRPLVYAEFGNVTSKNSTLVLSMVHGDEVTPLYFGLNLIKWLQIHQNELKPHHIIVAPMVNPDGFFRNTQTRVNSRGVDLNRNFKTEDWDDLAIKTWETKYSKDPRRNPGPKPMSEVETEFQSRLISQFNPDKILSIHSPLNMIDYDGPGSSYLSLENFSKSYVKECVTLKDRLKAKSTGYFPGSLGNYAGKERGIPTITLELPNHDSRKARAFWLKFSSGIKTMIEFRVPDEPNRK